MLKLSVAIITLNEESRIGECLSSVSEIADEVLVVDSFSTDKTKEICLSHGVRFIENEFQGHIEQKNFALSQAKYDFVLSLDADERLSQEAIRAIQEVKLRDNFDGFVFNRLTNYCGRWIRHCGWYPDRKLRLVDRRKAYWTGENPHDKLMLESGILEYIQADILHFSFPTIASHVKTANNFSEIAARQAYKRGRRINFFVHILLNPIYTFVKKYLIQLGFLDGFYGYVICRISAHSNFLKYTKIWQLYRENNHLKNG